MTDDSRPGDRNRPRHAKGGRPGGRDGSPGRQERGRGPKERQRRGEGRPSRPAEGAERAKAPSDAPAVPEDVVPEQLDPEIRSELGTLPGPLAGLIVRHLGVAGALIDEDPERAYEHAVYARRKASRVGAVREAAGLAAYRIGKWQEALSEFRAARRMTGRDTYLPVMADCERGLGRPERALELVHATDTARLDAAERAELRIVAAGARWDLGEAEAALVELQGPELKERGAKPWAARLFYAYAEALLELGRGKEAREYFSRASAVDREGLTDADERLAELEGLQIVDVGDDVVWTDAEESAEENGTDSRSSG